MKTARILASCILALGMMAAVTPARADSSEAMCEVRKNGDKNKDATGPCTFSQRQGYVDLTLRNGARYRPGPGQAEGQLESRGYVYKSGSASGDSKYSNWYNRSTGRCVTIRTSDGRYQSIVQAPPLDCGH